MNIPSHIVDRYNNGEYLAKSDVFRIAKIVDLVGRNKVVLDVGCNYGYIGERLMANNNKVYGIDFAKNAVEIARKKGILAKTMNVENGFKFSREKFDAVVAAEIIEHVVDTGFFLDEIHRILKKGGYVILSTPNIVSFGRRIMFLFGRNAFFEPSFDKPYVGHVRYFTYSSLKELLETHGFELVDYASDYISLFPSQLFGSHKLARLFPTFGRSLIVKAKKCLI